MLRTCDQLDHDVVAGPAVEHVLPRPAEQLVGTAVAKYDPQNPANSIIMCEHWLGFKERQN